MFLAPLFQDWSGKGLPASSPTEVVEESGSMEAEGAKEQEEVHNSNSLGQREVSVEAQTETKGEEAEAAGNESEGESEAGGEVKAAGNEAAGEARETDPAGNLCKGGGESGTAEAAGSAAKTEDQPAEKALGEEGAEGSGMTEKVMGERGTGQGSQAETEAMAAVFGREPKEAAYGTLEEVQEDEGKSGTLGNNPSIPCSEVGSLCFSSYNQNTTHDHFFFLIVIS